MGEEYDEEIQSLTKGKPEGDLSLVKQEKKEKDAGVTANISDEDDVEEDKRE